MKSVLTFLILISFVQLCHAQCTVKIGDDIHVCTTLQTGFPPSAIADNLILSNATAPFSYQWSIEPISYFNSTLSASDFLDDTTSVNPTALGVWEDSLTFFLKVEDANQQVCFDTVTVSASLFGTHLGSMSFTIAAGDSVQLFSPNVVSNYPIDSVVWRPNTGLTDSTALEPWASPLTDQWYYCVVWDSMGCMQEGAPFQSVHVTPVGIKENPYSSSVQVYLNQRQLVLNGTAEVLPYTFQLWDSQGRLVIEKQVVQSSSRISTEGIKTGVYLYSVAGQNGKQKTGKLLMP